MNYGKRHELAAPSALTPNARASERTPKGFNRDSRGLSNACANESKRARSQGLRENPQRGFNTSSRGLNNPRYGTEFQMSAGGTQRSCKREQTSLLDLPSAAEPRRRPRSCKREQTSTLDLPSAAEPRQRQPISPNSLMTLSTSGTHVSCALHPRVPLRLTLGYSSETTKSERQSKLACFSERRGVRCKPTPAGGLALTACKLTIPSGLATHHPITSLTKTTE